MLHLCIPFYLCWLKNERYSTITEALMSGLQTQKQLNGSRQIKITGILLHFKYCFNRCTTVCFYLSISIFPLKLFTSHQIQYMDCPWRMLITIISNLSWPEFSCLGYTGTIKVKLIKISQHKLVIVHKWFFKCNCV